MHIIETRIAPNPRRVRIFLAEKGIQMDYQERDLMAGDLKTAEFSLLNPWQRVPILVLDDGRIICESVAICRYFEECQPDRPLMGRDAFSKATIEMWQRRVELGLFAHITHAFRHLHPKMAHLEVPQIAAWGEANKPKVTQNLKLLDDRLSETRFVAGDDYSIADITALVAVDFMKPAKLVVPGELQNLARWRREVSARPSSSA
jgi:glutathione S-transferase